VDTTASDIGSLTDKAQRDLGVGTAWLVVLAAIARAGTPIHGYELARSLSDSAPPGVTIKHGTLYPILRTMESEGLVTSVLVASNEGPARKCFSMTIAGWHTLQAWVESWRRTRNWVDGVVAPIHSTVSSAPTQAGGARP
jgi:PadR family transcriptional regulator PadR